MESKTEHNQPSKEEVVNLKDFIDEHQKILAVIGVFVALSVFWSNLPLKHISSFISFLCLAATVPLFLEIYRKFDFRKSSWLLIIFLNIFAPLMGYTAWYLLIGFRSHWRTQMWNLVFWAFAIPIWLMYRRITLPERINNWIANHHLKSILRDNEKLLEESELPDEAKKGLREKWTKEVKILMQPSPLERKVSRILLNVIAGVIVFIVCGYIAEYLGKVINKRLDKVYESYNAAEATPSPTVLPLPSVSPTLQASPVATPTPEPSQAAHTSPSPT
ncbi:MAG TPA: hypothetical protein VF528_17855 [Pyrinomonadaceae bacterium]|jgi:hypothetical protein